MSVEKHEIKSILVEISNKVWDSDNLEESKNYTINFVLSSSINDSDKELITNNIEKINDKEKFDSYIKNSLLFYEGFSLNKDSQKIIKSKSKVYFTKETEDAIIRYNNCQEIEEKNKIYEEEIHYAFYKLVENIIHSYKYYYTEVENLEDLKHEVETFLLSKIHLFNPEKGAKAFSYFGTIAKRFLILSNQKNYKKKVISVPVDSSDSDENVQIPDLRGSNQEVEKLSYFLDYFVKYCTDNIYKIFPDITDAKVADAVLDIFRKRDSLTMFNKKALYIYIRDQVDVKTSKITKVVNKLYDIFYPNYVNYLETDILDPYFSLNLKKKISSKI